MYCAVLAALEHREGGRREARDGAALLGDSKNFVIGYCFLLRHPSIRRIAKRLNTTQTKHSMNTVSDSKNG